MYWTTAPRASHCHPCWGWVSSLCGTQLQQKEPQANPLCGSQTHTHMQRWSCLHTHPLQMDAFQWLTRLMYLFHLWASGTSAAVTLSPTVDQPASLWMCDVDNRVPHTCTPSSLLFFLLSSISFFPWPCSLEQCVHNSYHNEKWIERLAVLCHWMDVVCSPSQDAKGLVVVTDKMATASYDCSYAA